MDDLNALERQIEGQLNGFVGPILPVDDAAIFNDITAANQRKGWGFSMFSALKFVAASVIVALFGGFLLAGILTAPQGDEVAPAAVTGSPSPPTTEALLSSMVTDEVEPGIYQVINDGVRDLASVDVSDFVAGYDGGIWLLTEDGFQRLGSERSHEWPEESAAYDGLTFEVAPDGTFWIIAARDRPFSGARGGEALRSADGEAWAPLPCPDVCVGITLSPEGGIWASWPELGGRTWWVGHLRPTGWEPLDQPLPPVGDIIVDRLYPTDTGDPYATFVAYGPRLARYHDGTWSEIGYPSGIVEVGRDGTVWQSGRGTQIGESDTVGSELSGGLARFADGEWTDWTPADLPDLDLPTQPDHDEFGVAPDGSLWLSSSCDGLVRFDGLVTDHFLPGRCMTMDIATDGSVWALTDDDQQPGRDLFVITPKAVTAGEAVSE
jgi:hypothetical protein